MIGGTSSTGSSARFFFVRESAPPTTISQPDLRSQIYSLRSRTLNRLFQKNHPSPSLSSLRPAPVVTPEKSQLSRGNPNSKEPEEAKAVNLNINFIQDVSFYPPIPTTLLSHPCYTLVLPNYTWERRRRGTIMFVKRRRTPPHVRQIAATEDGTSNGS